LQLIWFFVGQLSVWEDVGNFSYVKKLIEFIEFFKNLA